VFYFTGPCKTRQKEKHRTEATEGIDFLGGDVTDGATREAPAVRRSFALLPAPGLVKLFEALQEILVVRCFTNDGIQLINPVVVRGMVEGYSALA
jgi:hypothetical protein